ncbi:MAG TPA: hypothetical protein VHI52_04320 [Verrucomicrobiae bacterium]|nr:hypothetical protein [Verrucomicrobiae bacterium]
MQVSTNGVWRTLSSETVSIPEVEPGTSNLNIFSGRLEPGQHVALAVEPPRNRIWRVGVHYAPEHTGLRSLWVRARLIWKTRNLCWRRGPVWTYSGEQAFSNEITQ